MSAPVTIDTRLAATVQAVRDRTDLEPRVGVVLGQEHEAFTERLRNAVVIPYATLPHMPAAKGIRGGSLVLGSIDDVAVACLVGRSRLGDGSSAWQVVHGVRAIARLGVRTALVVEATGVLDPAWNVGDLMLVVDHVNLAAHEGLGRISDETFEVFPNMRAAYDPALNAALQEVARTEKLLSARVGRRGTHSEIVEGVYANLQDPSYETPAQMRLLRSIGAHCVGTNMALEITALRQLGVRTAALAQLSYRAADLEHPALGDEETSRTDDTHFEKLLRGWVVRAHRVGD